MIDTPEPALVVDVGDEDYEAYYRRKEAVEAVVDAARLVAKRMARKSPYTAKCVKELMAAVDKLEETEK